LQGLNDKRKDVVSLGKIKIALAGGKLRLFLIQI